jgi:hypothetical protein
MAPRTYLRRGARFLAAASLVVAIWFALLAAFIAIAEPTHDVIVFAPPEAGMRAVAAGTSLLLDAGETFVVARGTRSGFVRELYAAGAWLVLPAMSPGCRAFPTRTATR